MARAVRGCAPTAQGFAGSAVRMALALMVSLCACACACACVRLRWLAGWPGRSPESGSGGYDELENFPNKVEIFTASVEGKLSDPSYIMKCAARPRSFARPLAQEVR